MTGKHIWAARAAAILLLVIPAACSQRSETYDDMDRRGAVEQRVRKDYGAFFAAVRELGKAGAKAEPDSGLIKRTAAATDRVIESVRHYPETVESRLALDALSYAARDLSRTEGFTRSGVSGFWQMALIDPIMVKGREFARIGEENLSTRMQLLRALQRGMGQRATTGMFLDLLPVVGTAPVPEIMQFADADTLAFKRVHDLILYSRSLQVAPPPLWMVTGPWLLALDVPGFFPAFFALVPVVTDRDMYLAIRRYEPGEIYEKVYRDPAPTGSAASDAWIKRASAAMTPFVCDRAFADSARTAGLTTFDAHYFFDDYIAYTDADSVKKEFSVSIVRRKEVADAFRFNGADSIQVSFTFPQLSNPDGPVTLLRAVRIQGSSMADGQVIAGRSGAGKGYLVAIGEHSDAILRKIDEASMPNIELNTR